MIHVHDGVTYVFAPSLSDIHICTQGDESGSVGIYQTCAYHVSHLLTGVRVKLLFLSTSIAPVYYTYRGQRTHQNHPTCLLDRHFPEKNFIRRIFDFYFYGLISIIQMRI